MALELIKNDKAIRDLKPRGTRLSDGGGLYLKFFVNGGSHGWRFDYTYQGKSRTLSLGTYPDVDLAMARETAVNYRKLVAAGQDPSELRKEERRKIAERLEAERRLKNGEALAGSFEEIARRWFAVRKDDWVEGYSSKVIRRLELHVFPYVGARPIQDLSAPDILIVCRRVEDSGSRETAHRVLELCARIYEFAIGEGVQLNNFCRDLRGALMRPKSRNFAAITKPAELAPLLRSMEGYHGTFVVSCALRLAPMLMLRPGEMRQARWKEIDLDHGLWYVPSHRLKRKKEEKENGASHLVPLPKQAIAILEELFLLTGRTGLVFPAEGRTGRCMSDGTINAALRALGYSTQETVTGHGFRATARTLLVELLEFPEAAAELQLGHAVKDANGTAYNRTEFLRKRIAMMQAWADYLEDLRLGRSTIEHPVLPEFTPVTLRLAANQSCVKAVA